MRTYRITEKEPLGYVLRAFVANSVVFEYSSLVIDQAWRMSGSV